MPVAALYVRWRCSGLAPKSSGSNIIRRPVMLSPHAPINASFNHKRFSLDCCLYPSCPFRFLDTRKTETVLGYTDCTVPWSKDQQNVHMDRTSGPLRSPNQSTGIRRPRQVTLNILLLFLGPGLSLPLLLLLRSLITDRGLVSKGRGRRVGIPRRASSPPATSRAHRLGGGRLGIGAIRLITHS